MLILHIDPPYLGVQGDPYYRTVVPCAALAQREGFFALSGSWLSPVCQRAALLADVLVLCQAVDADFLPVLQARRAAGKATVFEINDDFTAPQPWNPTASFCANPLMRQITLQLAREADGLQFSSANLLQRFGHLNGHSALFPNQLARLPTETATADPGGAAGEGDEGGGGGAYGAATDVVAVGFGGSPGHREDVRGIVLGLAEVMRRHPQVHFYSMVQADMREVFAPLPARRCTHVAPGDMAAYRAFVGRLDVGLAPLLPTPFNDGRSDVKFLEYTAGGAVSLCQDAPAYRGTVQHQKNGLLFGSSDDFVMQLSALVQSAELRRRCLAAAWQQVHDGRLAAQHAATRGDFLAALLTAGQRQSAIRRAPRQFDSLVQAHPTSHCLAPRYGHLAPGPWESRLIGALRHQDAAAALEQLAEMAQPAGNYLPYLYGAQRQPEVARALQLFAAAVERQPRSCAALHGMAQRLLRLGEVQRAGQCFAQMVQLAPSWPAGHAGLAQVAAAQAQPDRARHHQAEARRVAEPPTARRGAASSAEVR